MGWIIGLLTIVVSTGGAGFLWAFERHVPSFRQHLPDRVHKLIYTSLIFAVVYAGPTYFVYVDYIQYADRIPEGVWIVLFVAIIIPPLLGELVGIYWNRIRSGWEFVLSQLFNYDPEQRPYIPTAFDYVVRRRGVRHLVMIRYTDLATHTSHIIIGYLRHASATPYPQDMYLHPIYFHRPVDEFVDQFLVAGTDLHKQDVGCLINYRNVIYTKILLPDQMSSQAAQVVVNHQQEGNEPCQ